MSVLDSYEQQGLLFNVNFKEKAGGDMVAYRGELVIKEGEVADTQGRRKPPVAVMRHTVMLAEGDKLKLMAGALDQLDLLPAILEKYQADLAPGAQVYFYTVNAAKPMVVTLEGVNVVVVPMIEGVVWNELADLTGLEKADFKGQSSGEKVTTLYKALTSETPKHEALALDAALACTVATKRETRGAV